MKHLILLTLTVNLFLISCQDNYLTDLTPETTHKDHFYFDSPGLSKAFVNIASVIPDTVFEISQPSGLINRNPFTKNVKWITTDTFTFDPEDFQPVLNLLISTAEADSVQTSYSSPELKWVEIAGRVGYSKKNEYWLIPHYTKKQQRFFIQIIRKGNWWKQKYTANAIWMKAKIIDPKGDVS